MRIILLLVIGIVIYHSWPLITENLDQHQDTLDSIQSELNELRTELSVWLDNMDQLLPFIKPSSEENNHVQEMEKPELTPPKSHFSIHNIELGSSREDIEHILGSPKRSTLNEYGTMWHTYHQHYQNFLMVSYNGENQVNGIYTNQDLIASVYGIDHGTPQDYVREQLGEPIKSMRKGLVTYQLQNDQGYDLFKTDGDYISVFYDEHANFTVTAIQIISEDLETQRSAFYVDGSDELMSSFEYQLFDLTNATRAEHGLPILEWDDEVKHTARAHSSDMAENNYFSHTNLAGQSPFDRMQEDQIRFSIAGENLAYGQSSSVFAHEGLMNSLGHRENILKAEYRHLGVGVAFNSQSQPFYTEKFYSK